MKKTLAVILCVCMMLALFAGCGESASTQQPAAAQTEAPAEPADENALPEQYDLIMTFGAETGSVYAMGIQIGEYINSIAPDITCTVKVGAAASNLALLSTGETVIAHSQSDTIHEAIVGEGNFTELPSSLRLDSSANGDGAVSRCACAAVIFSTVIFLYFFAM